MENLINRTLHQLAKQFQTLLGSYLCVIQRKLQRNSAENLIWGNLYFFFGTPSNGKAVGIIFFSCANQL